MSEGMLAFHKSITSGTFNVYQCPAGKYAKVIINVSADVIGNVDCILHISANTMPTDIHTFQKESLNSVNNGFIRTAVVLAAGEWISYTTTAAGVTVIVDGIEFVTNSKEIASQLLIDSNTETVLYTAPVDETVTINTTISGVKTGLVNSANTKLYISSTNASGGGLLISNAINSGRTGYEYTGLVLTSGQKLILVTTNIVGKLSVRVHGFRRNV